jgi:hypothetical protein
MKKTLLLLVICFAWSLRAQGQLSGQLSVPRPSDPYALQYYQCDPLACNETVFDETGTAEIAMSIYGKCYNGYAVNPYLGLYILNCQSFWTLDLAATFLAQNYKIGNTTFLVEGIKIDGFVTPAAGGLAVYEAEVEKWCDAIVYSHIPAPISPC